MKKLNDIKNAGFKTPPNYFKDCEDIILSNLKIDGVSKNSGFTVPNNYFDDLTIPINNEPKVVSLLNKRLLITLTSVAAIAILFFSLIFSETNPTFKSIGNESIESYVINELSNDELGFLMDDLDLSESDFINYELNYNILESTLENNDEQELYNSFDLLIN